MTGHPVQLTAAVFAVPSVCLGFAVVVFRGPTPESMVVPAMGGPSLFSFHPFALAFPRCPELLFTFALFFSCLSSRFVFLLSHPQERMHFLCGRMLSLPLLAHVCWVGTFVVRTAQVAHACICTHSCCSVLAFFLRLSLE